MVGLNGFFFFPFRREEGKSSVVLGGSCGSGECSSDERGVHMFQGSRGRTMKWVTLLKDFKEKVGLTQSPPSAAPSAASPSSSSSRDNNVFSASQSSASSPSRSDISIFV